MKNALKYLMPPYLLLLMGCLGEDTGNITVTKNSINAGIIITEPEIKIDVESLNKVNREIYDVLSASTPCKDLDTCETVSITLHPKEMTEKSRGQRILVIDDGMTIPAYMRYKSRVVDHLFLFDDGQYESDQEAIQVPTSVFEVLSNILDERYPETTAKELNPVSAFFKKYEKIINRYVEHGDLTFATLADLNPNAEFLLADTPGIPSEILCSADKGDLALESLRIFLQNAADSLKVNIRKHGINYVNMSFGHTKNKLIRDWQASCAGELFPNSDFFQVFLEIYYREFYQRLFSLDNVVFVQAAADSRRVLKLNDPIFYADCQAVPNRVRAAGFSAPLAHIGINGAEVPEFMSIESRGALPCIDLVTNFGTEKVEPYTRGPFPVLMTRDGVGVTPNWFNPSASYAAPVVLSYINYLKQSGVVSGTGEAFVENLELYHSGKFIDPERHKQFEIYRLGRQ